MVSARPSFSRLPCKWLRGAMPASQGFFWLFARARIRQFPSPSPSKVENPNQTKNEGLIKMFQKYNYLVDSSGYLVASKCRNFPTSYVLCSTTLGLSFEKKKNDLLTTPNDIKSTAQSARLTSSKGSKSTISLKKTKHEHP